MCGARPTASTTRESPRLPVLRHTSRARTHSVPHSTAACRAAMVEKSPVMAMRIRQASAITGGCQSFTGSSPSAWPSWVLLSALRYPGWKTVATA